MVSQMVGAQTRRSFLRRLSALPVAILGTTTPLEAEPSQRRTEIGRFYIAGFQYYRGPELLDRVRPGDPTRLVAEPDNPYDGNAVRVEYHGEKLGYIPRRKNRAIGRLLRDGARIEGRVLQVQPDRDPWKVLLVEATLNWS